MRLIDADAFEQDLKEKLLPLLVEKYGKEEAMKGLHFSLQDCISNIQGQPTITQPEPERIPVSERLPKENGFYTFGNDEFNLEAAYHDCKMVFDGITDDDSFQEADTGLILYYANEIIYALHKALKGNDTNVPSNDCIDRAEAQTVIQFAARRYTVAHEAHGEGQVVWSENLINVIDAMNALRDLPSAQPEIIRCKDCKWKQGSECVRFAEVRPFPDDFCSRAERRTG